MTRTTIALFVTCALLSACREQRAEVPAAPAAVSAGEPASTTPAGIPDAMDTRSPLPLLPMMANHQKQNMRDHLLAVQEIVLALASEDYAAVEHAAARIGFSEQMGQMCTHMGAATTGFTEQALKFHHTADRITTAAREKNRVHVLSELAATLETCTGCHAKWKQEVVDEGTWRALTASPPPAGHGASH